MSLNPPGTPPGTPPPGLALVHPGLARLLDLRFDCAATLIELDAQNQATPVPLDHEALDLEPDEGLRARYQPALARAAAGMWTLDASTDTILLNRAVTLAHAGQTLDLEKRGPDGALLWRRRFTIQDAVITAAGLTLIAATLEHLNA